MTIVISLILLILAILAYRHHLRPKERPFLFALRLLVLFILVAIIIGEVFVFSWSRSSRRVAVLIDRSQSMGAIGAKKFLAEVPGYIKEKLPPNVSLEEWNFADSVSRSSDSLVLGGERTRLSKALEVVLKRRPGAVIVLSDGQDNSEKDPIAIAEEAEVPIYTIGFGSQKERNLTVRDVFVPPVVYALDTVIVKVRLQSEGFSSAEKAIVQIAPLGAGKELPLSSEISEQEAIFSTVFSSPGYKTLTVGVESLSGEITYLDNFRTAAVEVKPARVRVIYLTNRVGPNSRFILRALKNDPRVVVFPVLAFTGGFGSSAVKDPNFIAGDIFILDGVLEHSVDAGLWQEIYKRVTAGAGAFILAGPEFSSEENLSRLLPLKELRLLSPTVSSQPGFHPEFTEAGKILPWFETEGIDQTIIPPFSRVLTGTPLEHSIVILRVEETGEPLLVAGKVKKGKVVYLGGWDVWRWGFLPDFPPDKKTPLDVLLSGVIRYLSEKDTLLFRLNTDARTYLTGEPVRFTLTAKRPDGTPWEELDVQIFLNPGGLRFPMIEQEPGIYRVTVPGLRADNYSATAEVFRLRSSVQFEVSPQSVEMARLGMNRRLLSRLAEVTGGWFIPAESLATFPDYEIKLAPVKRRLVFDPRGSPWWFTVGALLFGVELLLRRSKGLL